MNHSIVPEVLRKTSYKTSQKTVEKESLKHIWLDRFSGHKQPLCDLARENCGTILYETKYVALWSYSTMYIGGMVVLNFLHHSDSDKHGLV